MSRVVVEPGVEGLGRMLADLVEGNLAADPARTALLRGRRATVRLAVTDADVVVGLTFDGRDVLIGEPDGRADLSIECDGATLLELTSVPLRFGVPDALTPSGRAVARKLLNGSIKVAGLPKHLPLMIRLQRLFSVAS